VTDRVVVLVVDDERTQRYVLRQYLTKEGYDVVEADNGLRGLEVLRAGGIDLALVDVMMPGLDGMDLVRLIRQESDVPIIMVTARGEESSRVAGLDLGADDYVVKPYSMPEVVARVRARLRHGHGSTPPAVALRAGAVVLDLDARRCTVNGEAVELTRREFDLLAVLVGQPNRVLTRVQLLEAAWGTTFVTEKTVDVHLNKLRAKLGDAVTVTALRGIGYRLEP
jgi:DNA-binding response OmpR family regulator